MTGVFVPVKGARAVCLLIVLVSHKATLLNVFTLLKNTYNTFSVSVSSQCRNQQEKYLNLIIIKITIPEEWVAWSSLKRTVFGFWILCFPSLLGLFFLLPCSSPSCAPLVLLNSAFIHIHPSCPSSDLHAQVSLLRGLFKVRIGCSGWTGP